MELTIFRSSRPILAFACCICGELANAGDWPQILGPNRNGKAVAEKLRDNWPKDGPAIVWQREVGSGFAGVAAAGETLVVWHRVGNESIAQALDAKNGKPIWKAAFATNYQSGIAPDNGPRCVPVIDGDRVFVVGAGGDLHAIALLTGKKVWSVEAFQKFSAPEGYFGAGSSPIVVGDNLIWNVGGPGAGIVAFNLADGTVAWKSTDEAASYSSPIVSTVGDKQRVIAATRLATVAIDPASGSVVWKYPFGMRGPTVNAATPLLLGDHLFLTASYGIGARWLKLTPTSAVEVWESDELLSSQFTTCVEHEGVLYGIDGRQDQGVARLRAIDPVKKRILWTEEDFGTANLIVAGDKLLIQKIDGELVLARASAKSYQPLAKSRVFETTTQPLPALSNGLLFVRDTKTLKALSVD